MSAICAEIGGRPNNDTKPALAAHGSSSRLTATVPAKLDIGILKAYEFAFDHDYYDLSYEISRRIIARRENNEEVPVYVPGTIHCMDDKSPPWAFLTDENNCVREMRDNFIFHKAAQQVTPIMEPATGVLQKEMLSTFFHC